MQLQMPTPVAGYAQGQGPSRPTTPVPDMRKLYGVAAGSPGLILPQGPAFALGKAQGMAGQGQPGQPIDQSQLVKGHQLDYWSDHNQCWMPATITEVDSESGSIYLNVKPNTAISRADQRKKIRARTIPRKDQVAMVQAVLQQEKVEQVAEQIYVSAAGSSNRPVPNEHGLKSRDLLG